jgi:DNA-directed RNA polymerase subunit M/transcription elongation factor TFIIS
MVLDRTEGVKLKKSAVEKKRGPDEIALQCRVFTEFPFPPKTRKAKIFLDGENRPQIEGYMPYWEKKVGGRSVKISANPHYGFPYGNDILIILYLVREARKQNRNGEIIFNTVNDFLRAFDYGCDEPNRNNAYKAFQRIFYATWFYEDGVKKHPFRVMAYCELFPEDGLFKNAEYKNKIVLTKEFWEVVHEYPVPYNFDTVVRLKKSPTSLSLYLFLVYRTWQNWKIEKKEIFIPFFGDNGLKNQLSSEISTVRKFRQSFQEWVEQIKNVWEDCPVYFKPEGKDDKPKGHKQKKYLDGIFIHCTSPDQLHVPPHWDKELRLAQEEGAALAAEAVKKCPLCGQGELSKVRGKIKADGVKMDDYYRCKACKKNVYQYQHPEVF